MAPLFLPPIFSAARSAIQCICTNLNPHNTTAGILGKGALSHNVAYT